MIGTIYAQFATQHQQELLNAAREHRLARLARSRPAGRHRAAGPAAAPVSRPALAG